MPKTDEELAAEEKATKEHREQLAREANQRRNETLLAARNAIADNADRADPEKEDLQDVTDEMLADHGGDGKPRTRAQQLTEQEEEAAAELLRAAEREDKAQDEARAAGADDIRKTEEGVTEYRLEVNGEEKWLTLEQLRARAGDSSDEEEPLQPGKRGAKREPDPTPTPQAQAEARRQAEERQAAEAAAYKAHLKELYTKASMGDEQAIDELAEIQTRLSRVTPDVLRVVNEQVDARMVGRTTFEKAVEWFETEYAPELSTNTLKAYAARRDREIANENPDMAPRARLKLVGEEMRKIRTDLGGKPSGKTPPSKLERKERAPQVPSAAGRQRPDAEPDEAESTQDTIRRMAQSRGQSAAIKH